ncbi:MAG: hypothetical protein JWR67_4026 [Mucilaginibacter sp.]|nr:hypothetical protein [Mucilaginibacter sp.]
MLYVISLPVISVGVCSAQSTALALKSPQKNVIVDGNAEEWGDSLSYYNPEKKIHYALANDNTNIFLVVKTNDPVQESNILNAGLTFSIDTKGRKRSAFRTTFPVNESGIPTPLAGIESKDQKAMKATFSKLKKIEVSGFKDISDNYIGTTNTYGIQVAINYDEKGNLVYEEAIPLALFNAGELVKNEWSFNIKLNGLEKPVVVNSQNNDVTGTPIARGGGGGRGGRSATGPGSGSFPKADITNNQNTPSIDFWGKFNLAKSQ